MSLDERLRAELHAVEPGPLREDDALDNVRLTHRRGVARRATARHALAVAVVVAMFASVAVIVTWRNTPDRVGVAAGSGQRFRSTATIRIAPHPGRDSTATTVSFPLTDADRRTLELALAPGTRRAALIAAHRAPDDSSIDFLAKLNPTRDLLLLTVTAGSAHDAVAVTREWASAFAEARRDNAIRDLRAAARRFTALLDQLNKVNAELVRIDPATFRGRNLGFPPRHHFTDDDLSFPAVPKSAPVGERDLVDQRMQIVSRLADLSADAARVSLGQPQVFTTLVEQTPPVRIEAPGKSKVPVLIGGTIGLVILLAGSAFAYRRRARSTRQVAA
jgi:hypothetical protein